jgi:hypothetical protein
LNVLTQFIKVRCIKSKKFIFIKTSEFDFSIYYLEFEPPFCTCWEDERGALLFAAVFVAPAEPSLNGMWWAEPIWFIEGIICFWEFLWLYPFSDYFLFLNSLFLIIELSADYIYTLRVSGLWHRRMESRALWWTLSS